MKERRSVPNTGAYARKMAVNVLAIIAVGGYLTMAYLSVTGGMLVNGFSEATAAAVAALVALIARTESPVEPPAGTPTDPLTVETAKKPLLTTEVEAEPRGRE